MSEHDHAGLFSRFAGDQAPDSGLALVVCHLDELHKIVIGETEDMLTHALVGNVREY